jgi:superfamily I DNA/RNA helicase
MAFATEKEIEYAHDVLIPRHESFDQEKLDVIQSEKSCYVQACPGSGKTTTLLAKLVILANRMPLDDGKGVCVLTHTNVAINEIKARLGSKADILFQYPNFFGTFQTFVDKFFTNKALRYFYNSSIEVVDDGYAIKMLCRAAMQKYNSLAEYLKHQGKKDDIEDNDSLRNKLSSIRIDLLNDNYTVATQRCRLGTKSGKALLEFKEDFFKKGILTYSEAYQLALKYIHEVDKDVKNYMSKRFAYVFVDEIQDCNKYQSQMLNEAFDDKLTIIQRFGDYCQAIYDRDGESIEMNNLDLDTQYINRSNRFGSNIANVLKTVCIKDNINLQGTDIVDSLKPIMIVYTNPLDVLPKFVELIKTKTVPSLNKTIAEIASEETARDSMHRIFIKACGSRGISENSPSAVSVQTYFPSFRKDATASKTERSCLYEYLLLKNNAKPLDCANSIIEGICRLLDLSNIKNEERRYTKTSLFKYLEAQSPEKLIELKIQLMDWSKVILSKSLHKDLQELITSILSFTGKIAQLMGQELSEEANEFASMINERDVVDSTADVSIYKKDGVEVEVSTVHAVKGETHVATLYLETSHKGIMDTKKIANQLRGTPNESDDANVLYALKVAYVGMSRPKYLLCYAIHKNRFTKINHLFLSEIWDVEFINEK